MDVLTEQLHDLYRAQSKHQGYQSVPDFVSDALQYREDIDQAWRGDRCRLAYLLEALPVADIASLTDIGANTGFFTLSLAHRFAHMQVSACEANRQQARFIRSIASAFSLTNVEIVPKGVTLRSLSGFQRKDAVLFLNVLHHAGFDFDQDLPRTPDAFSAYAVRYLAALAAKRAVMLFQMGSNWGGDKNRPLVARDAHVEKLRYLCGLLVDAGWRLRKIAYPTRNDDGLVRYVDLPAGLVSALDEDRHAADATALAGAIAAFDLAQFPGEFYTRPLFVCTSDALEGDPAYSYLRRI